MESLGTQTPLRSSKVESLIQDLITKGYFIGTPFVWEGANSVSIWEICCIFLFLLFDIVPYIYDIDT